MVAIGAAESAVLYRGTPLDLPSGRLAREAPRGVTGVSEQTPPAINHGPSSRCLPVAVWWRRTVWRVRPLSGGLCNLA